MATIRSKAVIWDFDGTIIDSFGVMLECIGQIMIERDLPMPDEAHWRQHFHGRMIDVFKEGLQLDDAEAAQMLKRFIALQIPLYEEHADYVFDDTLNLMQRIHASGHLQVIVSNRFHTDLSHASPRAMLAKPPLAGLVERAVCGDDNSYHKPDARVMEQILVETGLRGSDFTVIGDQFVDAQLAMNLGANAIIINRDGHKLPHTERLGKGWQQHVQQVASLRDVGV